MIFVVYVLKGGVSYNFDFIEYWEWLIEESEKVVEVEKKCFVELEVERIKFEVVVWLVVEVEVVEVRVDFLEWEDDFVWEGFESVGEEFNVKVKWLRCKI